MCRGMSVIVLLTDGIRVNRLSLPGSEVESLCQKIPFSLSKCLLYATYKQQYLELIDRQEYQKVAGLGSTVVDWPGTADGRRRFRS